MTSKKKDKVSVDLALCVLLVFTSTYWIVDAWARSLLQRDIFLNWIVISLCVIRLLFLLFLAPRNSADKRVRKIMSLYSPLALIWVYTGFLTFTFFLIPYEFFGGNLFSPEQNPWQFIISRGIKYSAYLILSLYIAIILKGRGEIRVFVRSLTFLLCSIEILAVAQLIIFQITGNNLFSIIINNIEPGSRYVDPTISWAGLILLRVNSVAHEPKGLASSMCLLLLIKIYWRAFRREFSPEQNEMKLDIYIKKTIFLTPLVLIATFSNNAVLYLFSVSLFVLALRVRKKFSWKESRLKLAFLLFLLSVLFLALSFDTSGGMYSFFASLFDASVGRRLGSFVDSSTITNFQSSIDPEDGAIFYIFENYSMSHILRGFGFGGFSNTAYPFVALRYGRDIVSPFSRNISIELLFSSGVIGVIISFYFFWKLLKTQALRTSSIFRIFGTFAILNVFLRSSEILFFVSISILISTRYIQDMKTWDWLESTNTLTR